MRKLILFFFVTLFVSCSTTKYQNSILYGDEELKINGKVKSITFLSSNVKRDRDTSKIVLIYNGEKLPQKQIDFYKDNTETGIFIYNDNNLLTSSYGDKRKWSSKNKYDDFGNLINYQYRSEGKLKTEKKFFYDKKNNIIKGINLRQGKPVDTTLYDYDYKKRVMTTYFVKSKSEKKTFYNKKGEIIRTDSNYGKVLYDYDKMGNILMKTSFNKNDSLKFEQRYINIYDEKRNLIETKVFVNNELYKTETYQIEYY